MEDVALLGLKFQSGKIVAQDHITKKIREFPDELKGNRQIRQFLGIVNYAFSHIPHFPLKLCPFQNI